MNTSILKQGQVLLITIMLLTTVITVTLAVTFKSRTETQLTKLEEESQKALAAAEAGIEAALSQGNIADLSTLNVPDGFSGSATVGSDPSPRTFVSPLLQKDQQYTFYLADYTNNFSNPYTGSLTLSYNTTNSSTCNNIALEITLIHGTAPSYTTRRFVADGGGSFGGSGLAVSGPSTTDKEGVRFYCSVSLPSIGTFPNAKILIVRTFFAQTNIGFEGNADFRLQGKYISSEAKSDNTGVTKKVELFQSYPQIPAEFFVTRF